MLKLKVKRERGFIRCRFVLLFLLFCFERCCTSLRFVYTGSGQVSFLFVLHFLNAILTVLSLLSKLFRQPKSGLSLYIHTHNIYIYGLARSYGGVF